METNKTIGNQGFSLIETLVTSGLISIAALAMAQSMLISAKTQKTASIQTENRALYDRISRTLLSEDTCTPSLTGQPAQGEIAVKDPLVSTTTIAQGGGATKGSGWSLDSVALGSLQSAPGANALYRGTLTVVFKRNSAVYMGAPIVTKTVDDVYVTVDRTDNLAAARILHCYGASNPVVAAKSSCTLLGGNWDDTKAAGTQCQITLAANSDPNRNPASNNGNNGDNGNHGDGNNGNGSNSSECQVVNASNGNSGKDPNPNALANANCNGVNNGLLQNNK